MNNSIHACNQLCLFLRAFVWREKTTMAYGTADCLFAHHVDDGQRHVTILQKVTFCCINTRTHAVALLAAGPLRACWVVVWTMAAAGTTRQHCSTPACSSATGLAYNNITARDVEV